MKDRRIIPAIIKKWFMLTAMIQISILVNAQRLFFEELTTAEGLPSDYVNSVFRDSKDNLWIATDKGACRYDGKKFLYFNKDNGLTSNFVNNFEEDPDGNVWLATMEGGVCKYDGKKITPFFTGNAELDNTRQIYFNEDRSFFIVTFKNLYYLRSENSLPEKIDGCSGYLEQISKDHFLVGKGMNDFYELQKTGHKLSFHKLPVHNLFRYTHNEFIFRNADELAAYKLDGSSLVLKNKFSLKKNSLPVNDAELKDILFTGNNLFVATVSGLIYADEKSNQFFFNAASGLGANYIRSIYEDKQGNIFFCTFGAGVKCWQNFYLQEFKLSGKVTSIFPSDYLTYITTSANIYGFNPQSGRLISFTNLKGGNYTAVYKEASGRFYLGTLNSFFALPNENMLYSFDKKRDARYNIQANSGTSGFYSNKKSLFISTYGEGITLLDNKHYLSGRLNIPGSDIIEFLIPLKTTVAALTYNSGISFFNEAGITAHITTKEKLLSNTVYSVFQEKDNEIWIGTYKGLNLYSGGKIIKTFTRDEGLIGTKIISIFKDSLERFWILSDKYLHLLENDRLRAIRSHPVLYNTKNSINRATYDKRSGLLYIGMNDAFVTVDVHKIIMDSTIQQPEISGVQAGEFTFSVNTDKITIPYPSGKITVSFSNQFNPLSQKNDLYYKLSGFDDDWKPMDNTAEAIYQKLPPGKYELLSKTVNPDGFASPETGLLKIEILPPLWKRTWFILLFSLLLLAGFSYAGVIISRKRYRHKLATLQEQYKLQLERERIARELHDNVGSQLTYLINKIEDNHSLVADKAEAGKLINFARAAMQELRETTWALNKKEVPHEELENKLKQLTGLYKDQNHKIEFEWTLNNHSTHKFQSLEALNIYRIVQEALNNAVKYSHASFIHVHVTDDVKYLKLLIKDNGTGFDAQNTESGYGLKNMHKRAEEINAALNISSQPGEGTSVNLHFPLTG